METFSKVLWFQVIIAVSERVLTYYISCERTPRFPHIDHLPALAKLGDILAKNLDLLSDDWLELDNASSREHRAENASAKLVKLVMWCREHWAIVAEPPSHPFILVETGRLWIEGLPEVAVLDVQLIWRDTDDRPCVS
jgi:hypothetical protein